MSYRCRICDRPLTQAPEGLLRCSHCDQDYRVRPLVRSLWLHVAGVMGLAFVTHLLDIESFEILVLLVMWVAVLALIDWAFFSAERLIAIGLCCPECGYLHHKLLKTEKNLVRCPECGTLMVRAKDGEAYHATEVNGGDSEGGDDEA